MSLVLVLILWSCPIFSQDSIVLPYTISEKKNLEFQESFFEALTQKGIKNYQKAIESLEACNTLLPKNVAVLFEFSKNYLKLNKIPQALEYVNEALVLEPENIWLLEHLVAVYKRDRNYVEAIKVQEQIAEKHPKKRQEVVYLHLRNKDNDAAVSVLSDLAEAKLLNSRLRRIRERLTAPKKVTTEVSKTTNKGSLEELFVKDKSFATLKKLLIKLDEENNASLLSYSEQGLSLFPAQPLVYLMNGKALNNKKNYKKAVRTLQNGIDFVIDDASTEKDFYKEMLRSYKGLGDTKNINKYQKKI